jgi:hypothetical protein
VLRAAYFERQLAKADASAVILAAVNADRTITSGFLSFAVVTIARLSQIVESVDESRAPATKADAINTCTFAARNLAESLRSIGIMGIARTLDRAKEDNGRWNPGMLNQINVVVQGLQGQGAQSAPAVEVASGPAEPKTQ